MQAEYHHNTGSGVDYTDSLYIPAGIAKIENRYIPREIEII
jgi:hypothetical protein